MSTADEKKRVLEEMLSRGDTMICLDSRNPEVMVPTMHQGKKDLRLVMNLGFRNPIRLLPDGIRADLRFSGDLFTCWIPYESLWAVYNPNTGEGKLWPENLPQELVDLLLEKEQKQPRPEAVPSGDGPGEEAGGVVPPAPELIPFQPAAGRAAPGPARLPRRQPAPD